MGTHFQVPILKGAEIVERAKQMQNGFGKGFKYVMSHRTGKIEILGAWEDGRMLFKYHQAKYDAYGAGFCRNLEKTRPGCRTASAARARFDNRT